MRQHHYTPMQPSKDMKKRSCLCSARCWIPVIAMFVVCTRVISTGWPLNLYNYNSAATAVEVRLQDEVENFVKPKVHSHKHYHRHGQAVAEDNVEADTHTNAGTSTETADDAEVNTSGDEESAEVTDPKASTIAK